VKSPKLEAIVEVVSGMRIGDVVGLQKSQLKGRMLFLNTQKSGSKIYVPLPKVTAEALYVEESLGFAVVGSYVAWSVGGLGFFSRWWGLRRLRLRRTEPSPRNRNPFGPRRPRKASCWTVAAQRRERALMGTGRRFPPC
jgi:integrase